MGQAVELLDRHQLRPFAMVTFYLIQGLFDSVLQLGGLGFDIKHRNAVNEEHDIRPDFISAIRESQLVRDVKLVCIRICRIEQPDVTLALFRFDENGFDSLQVFPSLKIALNARRHPDQSFDDLLGPRDVHEGRIQALELTDQDIMQDDSGFAPAHTSRILAGQVSPACLFRVADERILHRTFFSPERHLLPRRKLGARLPG